MEKKFQPQQVFASLLTGKRKMVFIFVLIFLSSIFLGVTFKLGSMYQELKTVTLNTKVSPDKSSSQNPADSQYGKRVAELAVVPAGEVPVEAVVADIDKIKDKNPAFYTNAQNGDVLLLYQKIAVIYSPSKDKIVAMMSFDPAAVTGK